MFVRMCAYHHFISLPSKPTFSFQNTSINWLGKLSAGNPTFWLHQFQDRQWITSESMFFSPILHISTILKSYTFFFLSMKNITSSHPRFTDMINLERTLNRPLHKWCTAFNVSSEKIACSGWKWWKANCWLCHNRSHRIKAERSSNH